MEVSPDDYKSFRKDINRQKYLQKESIRVDEVSYNALDNDEMNGEELIPDPSATFDETLPDKLLLEEMLVCFGQLGEDDRFILTALYTDGKSERALAKEMKISQVAIHKRRHKALKKLKHLMGFQKN